MHSQPITQKTAAEIERVIADGDLDALRELFAPDAVIWHNSDDTEKSVDASLAYVKGMIDNTSRRWYEQVRLAATDSGFVSRHYLCAALNNGQQVRIPACIVVTLEGERVSRLEEYIEAGAAAPLFAIVAEAYQTS